MAASKPKAKKEKKELSPNHVKHLRAMMDMARDPSQLAHPLVISPPDVTNQGYANQQVSGDDQMIPAKTGEYIIPEPVVKAKGTQFFDNLIKKVLQEQLPPTDSGEPQDPVSMAGKGSPSKGYKWGGEVREPKPVLTNYQSPGRINDQFPLPTGGAQAHRGGINPHWNDPNGGNWNPNDPDNQPDLPREGNPPDRAERLSYMDMLGPRGGLFAGRTFTFNPWLAGNLPPGGAGYQPPQGMPNPNGGFTAIPSYWNNQGYPFAQPATADFDSSGPQKPNIHQTNE